MSEIEFKQCECSTCHCPFVTDTTVCNNCRDGEHVGDVRKDSIAICDCTCHTKGNNIEDEADCKRCNCY